MSNPIRLRFAPSPTGFLHIGSLRTVLFTYLIAKKLDGKFILRIEDTDQKREVEGAVEKMIEILEWFDIRFDEGPHVGGEYGPYIQSERQSIYDKYQRELLDKDGAYPCFCTTERLEKMRADQQTQKQPPRYDRICRNLSHDEVERRINTGEKYVIRQKMPLSGEVVVRDELRGDIKFQAADLDDQVLIKNNGIPTYQFASVVDDHLMQITHVTRAEEWISSFPKNILLYKSFGWMPPLFFHYPVILSPKGGKLSKRDGDVAVEEFVQKGYLKEALLNFCALLGWHPKDEQEILTVDEIRERFEIHDMGVNPPVFHTDKLDFLNGAHIRRLSIEDLTDRCLPYLSENMAQSSDCRKQDKSFLRSVVALQQERIKKLSEIGELTKFLFVSQPEYDPNILAWKKMEFLQVKSNLEKIAVILKQLGGWSKDTIESGIVEYIKNNNLKNGEFLWPLRVALSGLEASPGPFEIAEVLGKAETLARIEYAINKL